MGEGGQDGLHAVGSAGPHWATSYMVASWGGYIFIINLIPAHVFLLVVSGRYSHRLYIAYCTFYTLGTLLSMQISFVSFQPVSSPEHLVAFAVFGLLQLYNAFYWLQSLLPALRPQDAWPLPSHTGTGAGSGSGAAGCDGLCAVPDGPVSRRCWVRRATSLSSRVSASTSPVRGRRSFSTCTVSVFLVPVGLYYCFSELNDANTFVILYVLFASYFSSIMVRLVLVLTPGACVAAAIGASVTMQNYFDVITYSKSEAETTSSRATNGSFTTVAARAPRVSKPVASGWWWAL